MLWGEEQSLGKAQELSELKNHVGCKSKGINQAIYGLEIKKSEPVKARSSVLPASRGEKGQIAEKWVCGGTFWPRSVHLVYK